MGRHLCHCTLLYAGTWNVHLLVKASGDRQVCHTHCVSPDSVVEEEIDLLVKELERYSISIAGVQETKWFGLAHW